MNREHPDSGRIVTSGDVINDLHDEIAQLRGTRKVLWSLLGECLPVIDALMQIPGDDDSDAHLNGLAGRINDARIADLEAQLEAIGAGGVSGPLIGQPQAMPDLSQLTERGAKEWAGVDAQGLRGEGFTAADMAAVSAQGFRDGVASVSAGWISVDERLPEPGNPVLLDIGKKFPIRALWAEKHTVRVGTDVDDWGEYDEETDEYYCPEGWYEWNEHEEVHWAVSETPRAWRELPQPLPAAPGPAAQAEGWISVDERLPEKNTEVLICFAELSIPSTGRYTASALDHEGWCYPQENHLWPGERPDFEDGGSPTVTHWMRLPAAPGLADGESNGWTAAQAISAAPAGATEMEKNLQRTAVGWQERALRAERNWVVCRRWAIAGGAPVEKLGDDPDQPFHAASPAIEGESNV